MTEKSALPREVLFCPKCGKQHLDRRWWAHRPHHKHYCAFCKAVWDNGHESIGVRAQAVKP